MHKYIIAALAALVGMFTVIPAASAAPYLSLSKGKSQIRSFERQVADGFDDALGVTVSDCYRLSRSSIECTTTVEFPDMDCDSTVRATIKYNGFVRVYSVGKSVCY